MEVDGDVRAYDALSKHPRIADLAAISHAVLTSAAEARRYDGTGDPRVHDQLLRLTAERGLSREDAATPLGNAFDVLDRGPVTDEEGTLARALAAHALAANAPADAASERRAAATWLWLAVHTPFDALTSIDTALGSRAPGMVAALSDVVRGGLAKAVGASPASPPPRRARSPSDLLRGQMASPPRGPVVTALLGLTGLLFLSQAARLFGRWALAYKTPAEIAVSEDGGVRLRWRVELLGRTLRDREVFVPREGLATASREVRFSGAALYAALLSLAIGSYVGVSAFVDGARAASPSLLASGLVLVAVGLGLDFVFSCVLPGARGRCRMIVVPRRGPELCIGEIDKARADAWLGALAQG
jgi:hypothetical protein